jgi:predicted transposase/invertase (TIGR01784 family)
MIPNPHDLIVKAVFGQPEHARGMLRAIAPSVLAEALDWSTLALQPGSFVDAILSSRHTDLLYSTTWRDSGEALVYLLFEHQSAPPTEELMAERMLRYQGRIWDRWRVDHPKAKRLPMILPIVMYHGTAPWREPRSFDALLDVPDRLRPAVQPYLVRFEYVLHDLSEVSDEELRGGAMRTALAKLVVMCLKHARTRADFLQILSRWMDVAREVLRAPHGLEALAQVVRYILEVNEHVEPEELRGLLERDLGPETKDAIMTAGQRLIEQGRQQGIQQGIQGVLLRLLRQRFGDAVNAQVEQRIATASLEQVETWTGRVLSAATLAAVIAD